MATTKVSYKKSGGVENKQLSQMFSESFNAQKSAKTVFQKMKVDEIKFDEKGEFQKLFPIEEENLKNISEAMKNSGYDNSEPLRLVKILDEDGEAILGDGHTRLEAAKIAGIKEVPIHVRSFDTRRDATVYLYLLQLNRRNLTSGQRLAALAALDELKNPGRKAGGAGEKGKSADKMSELLGVSPRTVEKMRNVLSSEDDEIIDAVMNDEISVSAGDKAVNEKKSGGKKSSVEIDDGLDDISDALGDNCGNPHEVYVHLRDMSERLSPPEEDSVDRRMIERFKDGFVKGFKKGVSEIAYEIYDKIISLVKDGKSAEEIENDKMFADFTFTEIAPKFEIPTDSEGILREYNK